MERLWLVDMRRALKISIVGTFLTDCLLLVHIGSASQIIYCLYIWDMSHKISIAVYLREVHLKMSFVHIGYAYQISLVGTYEKCLSEYLLLVYLGHAIKLYIVITYGTCLSK